MTNEIMKLEETGIDLGFVDLTTRLLINGGKFVNKDNEKEVFNEICGIILRGSNEFFVWGKDETPDEGKLMLFSENYEAIKEELKERQANDEIFAQLYGVEDIQEKYLVKFIAENKNIYSISLAKTSKTAFGLYAKQLFLDIRLGVSKVVTKMEIEGKKKGKFSWNQVKFSFVKAV